MPLLLFLFFRSRVKTILKRAVHLPKYGLRRSLDEDWRVRERKGGCCKEERVYLTER